MIVHAHAQKDMQTVNRVKVKPSKTLPLADVFSPD